MKYNYKEFFNTVGYQDSILARYLKDENWELLDGLLLLGGLSPEETVVCSVTMPDDEEHIVDNLSSLKNNAYKELPQFYLKNLQPLDVNLNFSICLGELGRRFSKTMFKKVLSSMICRKSKKSQEEIDQGLKRAQVNDTYNKMRMVIKSYEDNFQDLIRCWFSGDDWDRKQRHYPVKDFIELAGKNKIKVPWLDWAKQEGLINLDNPLDPRTDNILSFLDKNHNFHSPELQIAVDAWTELYEKHPPKYKPKGGHKKYISNWLSENYPDLGPTAIKRISIVVNPDKKGGAIPIM